SPSRRPAAAPGGAPSRSQSRSGDSVSEERQPLFRKPHLDEMTVGRTEKPVEGKKPAKPDAPKKDDADDGYVRRHRPGIGSYEDPADERRSARKSKKTGRPGR